MYIKNKIKKILGNSYAYIIAKHCYRLLHFKYYKYMSDEKYLINKYKKVFGVALNVKNPITFNEKLQWLKLNNNTSLHTVCADKILVKDYVKNIIGEKYIIPTIYITERISDINSRNISNSQFVIKTNHNSGGVIICKNIDEFNWVECRLKLSLWIKEDFYKINREPQYKYIKRGVIVEELIQNKDYSDLQDYKIFVFNGVAKLIQVDANRSVMHTRTLYDRNWTELPIIYGYSKIKEKINKPSQLADMLSMAEALGAPFVFARIDFYITEEQIYFGEITFHPESGFVKFKPENIDKEFGDMLKI